MNAIRAEQVRFTVKLHPHLYERLSAAAEHDHISRSDVVRLLLSERLPEATGQA